MQSQLRASVRHLVTARRERLIESLELELIAGLQRRPPPPPGCLLPPPPPPPPPPRRCLPPPPPPPPRLCGDDAWSPWLVSTSQSLGGRLL